MNAQERKITDDMLAKYASGNCTPEEERVIDTWYEGLDLPVQQLLETDRNFTAKAEASLRSRLKALPRRPANVLFFRKPYLQWTRAAAAAILLMGSVYLYNAAVSHKKAAGLSVIATGRNELKKFTLPDGSIVWLNHFSQLEWSGDFKDSVRIVKLSGEALFTVSRDENRSFIVQAGNTRTRVLGTEFNVEAYTNEQEIKVSLLNGKVQFSAGNQAPAAILLPGKMATYHKNGDNYQVSDINGEVSAWTKGFTVFNEVPLEAALDRLARKNGWTLTWKRKTRPQSTVSAVYSRETPAQMLEGIAFTHHLKYKLEGSNLVVY